MTENQRDNVHEYRRERLEPEIAAMSVEIDEEDNPIVIVNIDDPAAKKAIKKVIVWLGGITGLAWLREWAAESAQRQIALAAASTAAVVIAGAAVMTDVTRHDVAPAPPITAERIVTLPPLPPVTITAVPSTPAKPSRRRTTAGQADGEDEPPPSTAPPPRLVTTPRSSSTAAPATSPRAHTTKPTASPKTAEPDGRHGDADSRERSAAPPATTPPSPQPTAQPEPTPEPTVAAAQDCDGVVEVDLDPLLDLCLLG
ncbi:hypothetical protein ACWEJ6_21320 [Nonomuraea sp. NPDC004702]